MVAEKPGKGGADEQGRAFAQMLRAAGEGDAHAASDLLPVVYDELRRLAASRLRRLPPGQTLQPTALVHDAYLRLIKNSDPGWSGRGHFFGAAAMAMRNILVEHARRKDSVKHGGGRRRVDLGHASDTPLTAELSPGEVLGLDAALDRLEREHPRQSRVVLLRYFAGMTNEQIADMMDVGVSTIKRDWRFARAWLRREMGDDPEQEGDA